MLESLWRPHCKQIALKQFHHGRQRVPADLRTIGLALSLALFASCSVVRPEPVSQLLAAKASQLLLVGFRGTTVDGNAELEHLVCRLKVGGVILFQIDWTVGPQVPRNIASPTQVKALTEGLQRFAQRCGNSPLLIAADNEGGQVQRLNSSLGYTPAMSHAELGSQDDLSLTELESRRIARTLSEAGINWNLAPVVDLALNPENSVIVQRGRSFGADPERVTAHARAFVLGHREEQILTSLKHYPGHGSSRDDSHKGFVDISETARLDLELVPYRQLIREGLVDSIMTAHVYNNHLDAQHPATLSRATITKLLREELGFDGVVVSDDLHMGAIVQHYGIEEAAILALQAGVDLLLLSNNGAVYDPEVADRVHAAILRAISEGRLDASRIEASYDRIQKLKSKLPR